MTLAIAISGALAVAITAKIMYFLFLGGKTVSNVSFAGRILTKLRVAFIKFADGWREQSFSYKFVAYPSMLVSMGLTSLVIYGLTPVISDITGFWNKFRYCLLIILAGVPASLCGAFVFMYVIYLLKTVASSWWRREDMSKANKDEPAEPTA